MENTNNKNRKKSKRRKNLKKRYSIVLAILAVLILMIIGGIILTHKPDKDSGKQTNTAANTESPSNENTNAQNESESEKVSDIKAQPVDETNLKNLISNAKGIQTTGYTQDSINALNSAVNDAETLLKTDFSQNEVEDACKKIIDAIQVLKK